MANAEKTITVLPNYGRDYSTAAEVQAGYRAGHDFRVQDAGAPQWNGMAVNKEDAEYSNVRLKVRFNKLTDFIYLP